METLALQLVLDDKAIDNLIKRYHFSSADRGMLKSLAEAALPLTDGKAYYEIKDDGAYALCVCTLGAYFDRLQSIYLDKDCISEGYMLDCIGLELLSFSYEQLIKYLQERYGKWAISMEFIGEKYPMEMLPELLREFDGSGISCNEEFMLSPLKSVLFFLSLSDKDVGAKPCDICVNCGNVRCMFRKYDSERASVQSRPADIALQKKQMQMSYGVSRIFSNKGV